MKLICFPKKIIGINVAVIGKPKNDFKLEQKFLLEKSTPRKHRGSVYEEEVSQKKMKWQFFLEILVFE